MNRTALREHAFQLLYSLEMQKDDVEEQIKYLLNTKFEPYDNEFAKKRFIKVIKEEIKIE